MKYTEDLQRGHSLKPRNQKLLAKLKKDKSKNLDQEFHKAHDEVFQRVDCLECANCCKTTSPIFLMSDVERLAHHLKNSTKVFMEQFLRLDEEGDYVLQSSPCPFLQSDNKCSVYESRPKACREYPHTNRKRIYQLTELTLKNSLICPAVVNILDRMSKIY